MDLPKPARAPSLPITGVAHFARLDAAGLRLAVRDCVLDGLDVPESASALWREDPEIIAAKHGEITMVRADERGAGPLHGRLADLLREAHRPIVGRPSERGLTVDAAAERIGVPKAAFVALAEAHGYLGLAPFGRTQGRRLVTDRAVAAGIGWNVDATKTRIARLDGFGRAAVFPVFDPARLEDVAWTFDWAGIVGAVRALARKRDRVSFLLTGHDYLPDTEVAALAEVERRTVARARRGQEAAERPNPPWARGHGRHRPFPGGMLEWVLAAREQCLAA